MLVLGLSGNFSGEDSDVVPGMREFWAHDAAATLVRDGELVAAVEEERFNRIKKTTKFPINAVKACLETAGVSPADVDAVGYYFPEQTMDLGLNVLYTEHSAVPTRYSRALISDRLSERLGWDPPDDRLHYTPHHRAHALPAFLRSGMSEALVVVLDAAGEESSGTVYHGVDGQLHRLASYPIPNSLGRFYLSATELLGYRLGDEYKVMGLAPYGNPDVYKEVLDSLYTLTDDGDYQLVPSPVGTDVVGPAFFALGVTPRRRGEEFSTTHRDIAAGVQRTLETIVLHVIGHWVRTTGLRRLCFTGGVAHNSSLNGTLLRSGLVDEIFVHPASHDAGASEGAALDAERHFGGARWPLPRLRNAALGPALGSREHVLGVLGAWDSLVEIEKPDDVVDRAASLLAEGRVLGWAQGRSEFGPRALGNRSIVADPRPASNQTRINAMIKKRESFRPFAPSVTRQAAGAYFDLSSTEANHDFMSFVVPVRPEVRDELGAVTHVDGTARVQIVDPEVNERFHRLIARFGELTGTPVLLNTSFNNNAEPIVQTVQDVLTSFLTTDLDHVVVEDFLIHRKPRGACALEGYMLRYRPTTRLDATVRASATGPATEVATVRLDYATGPSAEISAEMHTLLRTADGRPLSGLSEPLHDELWALWQQRFFTLSPI